MKLVSVSTPFTRQKDLIWNTNWKYLIILDACRYDYFQKVYKKYLNGELKKVISPASETREWLKEIFRGKIHADIIYISANPYINSKGITIGGFNPKRYLKFYRVLDVWDWGWNEILGTVHPEEVNKATLEALRKYPGKRFIIHSVQPHRPYLILAPRFLNKVGKILGHVP